MHHDVSDSRERVRAVVAAAAEPLTSDQVATACDLAVNTVRGHLDVLLALGAVSRTAAPSTGRGRPRWLYSAGMPTASPLEVLADVLTRDINLSVGLAEAAAQRWEETLPELPEANTPDEAVDQATAALNALGFAAKASPVGDAICVTSCPYAELVRNNPVICEIHTALVARILVNSGQPVTLRSMEVLNSAGACVARLDRPDLTPQRTIDVAPEALGKEESP